MRLCCAAILALGVLAFARIAAADTVTVFAAASLKDALDENAKVYQLKAADRIVVSYGRARRSRNRSKRALPRTSSFRRISTGWTTSSNGASSRPTPGGIC